jgi:hypothetical protein
LRLHCGTSRYSPGIAVFLQGCLLLIMSALVSVASAEGLSSFESTYSEWVDAKGKMTLPDDFQTKWVFLGTWSIAEKDVQRSSEASGHGAAGLHNVYTQPGVVEYFREHQSFPDGAVIIKELLKGETATMTTGTVSRAGKYEGWFVMVKDTQGRFKDNPLWGDGWGWSLFNVDSDDAVTQDYRTECLGCHIPAQKKDWIYTEGYPLLRPENY